MRRLFSFGYLAFCLNAGLLRAQDAPLPQPETLVAPPPAGTSPSTAAPVPQLINAPPLLPIDTSPALPPPAPNLPGIPQLDEAFKPPPLQPAAENHRRHVEWRRLKNRVVNDREVKAALAAADAAITDLERRRLLRRYYEVFFGKMIALTGPEMKSYVNERKNEHLSSLPQPRVRPDLSSAQSRRR